MKNGGLPSLRGICFYIGIIIAKSVRKLFRAVFIIWLREKSVRRKACGCAGGHSALQTALRRKIIIISMSKIKKINFYFNKIKYKLKIIKIGIDNAAAVC